MENLPELSSLSDKELKSLIRELVTQERSLVFNAAYCTARLTSCGRNWSRGSCQEDSENR